MLPGIQDTDIEERAGQEHIPAFHWGYLFVDGPGFNGHTIDKDGRQDIINIILHLPGGDGTPPDGGLKVRTLLYGNR